MVTDTNTLISSTPAFMVAPLPWKDTLGWPVGTWCFPTESSICLLEQIYDLSLGLQAHNSSLASSCLHLSLLAHRQETNSNQKEICARSLGYMSQTQRVRLTLLNASVLCSHSPFWLLYSSKLPLFWSYFPWANFPSSSIWSRLKQPQWTLCCRLGSVSVYLCLIQASLTLWLIQTCQVSIHYKEVC